MNNALQPAFVTAPGVNLEAYVQSVQTVPVLSAEEEKALAEKLFFEDDVDAASAVIRRVMETAAEPIVTLSVPLGVEIGTGPSWGAAH